MTLLRPLFLLAAAGALLTTRVAAQPTTPATAPPGSVNSARPGETLIGTGPNGAMMRCRDGSYPAPNASGTACDTKGGVLVRFPVRRIPAPAAARPARVPAPAPPTVATDGPSSGDAFQSRARIFVPAERAPDGATLQCVDGSFIVADTVRARCAARGGVRVTFPPRPRG